MPIAISVANQPNKPAYQEKEGGTHKQSLFVRRFAEGVKKEEDSGLANIQSHRSSVSRAPSLSHVPGGARIPAPSPDRISCRSGTSPHSVMCCIVLLFPRAAIGPRGLLHVKRPFATNGRTEPYDESGMGCAGAGHGDAEAVWGESCDAM